MLYACIVEHPALLNKPEAPIKSAGVQLRMQADRMLTALTRALDERVQQGRPAPPTSMFSRHCHAPDLPVGQQTRRANGQVADPGHRMLGHQVALIKFQRRWHTLLHHKYRMPQWRRNMALPGPIAHHNAYSACRGHFSNAVMVARQLSGTGTPLRAATSA